MKQWVKIHCYDWLEGSIMIDMDISQRYVWSCMIVLGGLTRDGLREGYLERSKGIPYTEQELADKFHCDLSLIQSTIAVCLEEGRLTKYDDNTLYLTNWEKYQSKTEAQLKKEAIKKAGIENKKSNSRGIAAVIQGATRTINKVNIATEKLNNTAEKIDGKLGDSEAEDE